MKNKIKRICIWILFSLFVLASGAVASVIPYSWGERDGSGILLWFFTIIPFLILLFSVIMIAIAAYNGKSIFHKPYMVVFYGSLGLFFLNWLVPYMLVNFDYFSELGASIWMWIMYVGLPFIYGGVSYFLFKK